MQAGDRAIRSVREELAHRKQLLDTTITIELKLYYLNVCEWQAEN